MTQLVLDSKIRVPDHRPDAVPRPRVVARLDEAVRAALTVVSAPPGFGKTTLLTEWLATLPGHATGASPPVGWVSLDSRDNDPGVFWTYVVLALRAAAGDGVGTDSLELLESGPRALEAALAALRNDVDALATDVVLVLDDYHLVESRAVHDGVTRFLEPRPSRLHLVLATRADPPLPLARLRARAQLVEVRAADLRFTVEEAGAYLNDARGLQLGPADVTALERRTEGWAAALQLAALSLQDRADASAFIAGFAGDDRYVVDYLVEEVLARQPADVRDFLLHTSVLERLTGPLCDALTGRDDGRAMLVTLERANLFLVPLDATRHWYRYHHLFADVLRAHLADERPGQVAELHRRASAWFEDAGDRSQAIGHALAAGDHERAAELMERAMPRVQRERREGELTGWARALPDAVVRARPVLGVAFAGALAQVGEFATVGRRLDDIDAAVRRGRPEWPEEPPPGLVVVDRDAYRFAPGHIAMYRAALALTSGDPAGTVAHAREALALALPGDDLTRSAAAALGGLASWTTGDVAAAYEAYLQAVPGLLRAGFVADVLGCSIAIADLLRTQGRLEAAVDT